MENSSKANVYFYSALLCAVWFILTSWFWAYFVNVVFSFPIGLVGLFLWYRGKKQEGGSLRFRIVQYILIAGVVTSILPWFFLK